MKYKTKPVVVRDLFDAETYATIIRFMDEWVPLIRKDTDLNEPDSINRFGRYSINDANFFTGIHHQLTDFASDLFSEEVKPSYSFLSMYETNGQCPLHIDRPQCRYTIDYLIRQEQTEPWPIAIGDEMTDSERSDIIQTHPQTDDECQRVIDATNWTVCNLNPNDAVCYSGTNTWHYRPERSKGKADLVFFHFVPRSFRGSLS